MLLKQNRTISYICPECGLSNFENISLFDFSGKKAFAVECKCKQSRLEINTNNYKKYFIHVPCMGCGLEHQYILDFYNMWIRPISTIKCKANSTQILFLGFDNEVATQLDALEAKKDEVADIIGFEKIFSNSSVMLAAIDKIHEIFEKNEITCECGCNNILIDTKEDGLILQCSNCSAIGVISAKNNLDLKRIQQVESIVLYKNKHLI